MQTGFVLSSVLASELTAGHVAAVCTLFHGFFFPAICRILVWKGRQDPTIVWTTGRNENRSCFLILSSLHHGVCALPAQELLEGAEWDSRRFPSHPGACQ